MKRITYITLILVLLLSCMQLRVFANQNDSALKNLSLSGFLRLRHWHTVARTKFPDAYEQTNKYDDIYYEDVFFRNRLEFQIMPELEIKTVFDISAFFGKENFALGNGGTNIITRDIYAVFKPYSNLTVEAGLRPFSFPGGFILARDATGIEFNHRAFKGQLKTNFGIIKAFDDANDSYGAQSDQADYKDDTIYFFGMNSNISQELNTEIYYVYEHDSFISDDDNRKAALHWIGMHNKYVSGDLFINLALIYNWGKINLGDATNSMFSTTGVSAGLFSFEAGYKFEAVQLSLLGEGATGDANDLNYGGSFQDIKASRGYSLIAVDNMGGISLRGSGESSWYGLYSGGLKFIFTLFDSIEMDVKLLHFRTTKAIAFQDNPESTYLGDELNIKASYKYHEKVTVYLNAASFLPQDAYCALESINKGSKSAIFEIMAGTKMSY